MTVYVHHLHAHTRTETLERRRGRLATHLNGHEARTKTRNASQRSKKNAKPSGTYSGCRPSLTQTFDLDIESPSEETQWKTPPRRTIERQLSADNQLVNFAGRVLTQNVSQPPTSQQIAHTSRREPAKKCIVDMQALEIEQREIEPLPPSEAEFWDSRSRDGSATTPATSRTVVYPHLLTILLAEELPKQPSRVVKEDSNAGIEASGIASREKSHPPATNTTHTTSTTHNQAQTGNPPPPRESFDPTVGQTLDDDRGASGNGNAEGGHGEPQGVSRTSSDARGNDPGHHATGPVRSQNNASQAYGTNRPPVGIGAMAQSVQGNQGQGRPGDQTNAAQSAQNSASQANGTNRLVVGVGARAQSVQGNQGQGRPGTRPTQRSQRSPR
ncbi:hypothetical protein C8F01DRAFT_1228975 [Mycena amicta]|nr:hypothetical protein C8F01DRAFT_1228975 [Mycena amicta]